MLLCFSSLIGRSWAVGESKNRMSVLDLGIRIFFSAMTSSASPDSALRGRCDDVVNTGASIVYRVVASRNSSQVLYQWCSKSKAPGNERF